MATTFIDLFAGIGGFRAAGERLGGQCLFSCEIDKHAQKVYKHNFKSDPYPDITRLSPKDLPDFDTLFAGFPCQPFSVAGNRKGFEDEKNGNLFFYVYEIAKIKKPPAMVLENVRNFLNHNNGNTYAIIRQLLEGLGYNVYTDILNAKYFNLAQSRERVFIVAIHKDIQCSYSFSEVKLKAMQENKTIVLEDILDNEPRESLFYSGEYFPLKDDINYKVHKPYQIAYAKKGRQGERIYSVQGTSITISHSTGGVFPKTGGYKTREGIRTLSVNEVKRAFGFSDDYTFDDVSDSRAIALLGNSVPVNVVEAVISPLFKEIFFDKA